MYTVYRHYNRLTNKSYIGMTSQEPKKRWRSGKGYKNNLRMWNDIQNSNWNTDWEHNIIGQSEDKQEALNIEEMFIWLFDSTNDGYNISSYGNGHYERTEEQKRKMSEANTGKHFSEEHKKKIRENSPSKAVIQLSKDGEFIAEYSSIHEAERQTECQHQSICECCKGERKSTGGFIWKYKEI